jgi:hypothetical protein
MLDEEHDKTIAHWREFQSTPQYARLVKAHGEHAINALWIAFDSGYKAHQWVAFDSGYKAHQGETKT